MLSRTAKLFLTGSVLGSALVAATATAQPIQFTSPAAAPAPVAPSVQAEITYEPASPAQTGYGYRPVPAAQVTPAPRSLDDQLRQMPPGYIPSVPSQAPAAASVASQPQFFGEALPMTDAPQASGNAFVAPSYPAPMPTPQSLNQTNPATANESFFISGGVGKAERDRLEAMRDQYNFYLQMATSGGAFVSGVNVQIKDAKGNVVLETVTDGPLLMAKLPQGKYIVQASKFGETKTQNVQVGAGKGKTVNVFWKQEAA
jgi:hypothetical protein